MNEEAAPHFGQVWGAEFVSSSSQMPYRPSGRERMMLLREGSPPGWWYAVSLSGPSKGLVEEVWTRFSFHERMRYLDEADEATRNAWVEWTPAVEGETK